MGLILPPLAVLGILVLITHFLLSKPKRVESEAVENDEERAPIIWAQTIACFFALVDNISFAIVIPDSYSLVMGLGGTPALSGISVGICKFGMAFGALLTFALMRKRPSAWQTHGRCIWLVCASLDVAGATMYAFVCWHASGHLPMKNGWSKLLLTQLLGGRLLLGMGGGMRMMMARTLICHVNDKMDRARHMEHFVFSIMLGLGLGPLISSGVKTLDMQFCDFEHRRFEVVGLVSLSLTCSQLVMALRYPSLDDAGIKDYGTDRISDSDAEANEENKAIVWLCLAFAMVRGVVVSGMEVGTSMALETEFNWSPRWIGAAVGLAFLTSIPVKMLHNHLGYRLRPVWWMLLLLLVSLPGCCCLFRVPTEWLDGWDPRWSMWLQTAMLLCGDAIVFPCVFLSDGLNQGIMFQHLMNAGGLWLNVNWVSLIQTLLVDGLARSLGPPLARGAMHIHGRNHYALQQLLFTLINVLVVIFGLLPRANQLKRRRLGASFGC